LKNGSWYSRLFIENRILRVLETVLVSIESVVDNIIGNSVMVPCEAVEESASSEWEAAHFSGVNLHPRHLGKS